MTDSTGGSRLEETVDGRALGKLNGAGLDGKGLQEEGVSKTHLPGASKPPLRTHWPHVLHVGGCETRTPDASSKTLRSALLPEC